MPLLWHRGRDFAILPIMRLKIATIFAMLCFVCLAVVLIKLSSKMPETAVGEAEPAFAFNPNAIDGEKAVEILKAFLETSPRDAGTEGASKAAVFIADSLAASGLEPKINEFEDNTPDGKQTFRNVTATISGDGTSCIVLLSHYDTKSGISPEFTGANDSGSSTALLLHMAKAIGKGTNNVPDIVFAFVDGEECAKHYSNRDGLHGSRHLADILYSEYGAGDIRAVILLDMIGDRDLTITVPRNSTPELTQRLFAAARKENAREKVSLYGPMLDDHVPFLEKGIPAIDIIDFYYGSTPRGNQYWHTDEDSLDKISGDSLELTGRIALRIINSIISEPLEK